MAFAFPDALELLQKAERQEEQQQEGPQEQQGFPQEWGGGGEGVRTPARLPQDEVHPGQQGQECHH